MNQQTSAQSSDGSLQIDPSQARNTDRKRSLIAELSSIFALVVSVLALSLGAYQARLMNEQTRLMQGQARASVWPYISIGYSISDSGEKLGYTWEISNDGVGPARIESVILTMDGAPLHRWRDVFQKLFGNAPVPATYSQIYGKVLAPGTNRETTIEALHIQDIEQAKTFFRAQERMDMAICYCSVYDDCWIAHRQQPEVQPVARCDIAGTVQFEKQL
jgi:hypothetical protein